MLNGRHDLVVAVEKARPLKYEGIARQEGRRQAFWPLLEDAAASSSSATTWMYALLGKGFLAMTRERSRCAKYRDDPSRRDVEKKLF